MPKIERRTTKRHGAEELTEALRAVTSLIGKCSKVMKKLRPGTPQATLTRNRLKAFRIASKLIKREMNRL